MKNVFTLLALSTTIFSSLSVHAQMSASVPLQDAAAAVAFFTHELEFTTNPFGVQQLIGLKEPKGVIVDLRKKEDFEQGHIPGAINLPWDQWQSFSGDETSYPGLRKDVINYVYCYELLCNLGQKAALRFASLGYPVKEMRGGFQAWRDHNYPIEMSAASTPPVKA